MMKGETRAVTLLLEWRIGGWMKMVNRIISYVPFSSNLYLILSEQVLNKQI